MAWLLKQNILFNRSQKLVPLLRKFLRHKQQRKFLFTSQEDHDDKIREQNENYSIAFPYSSNLNPEKIEELDISKITVEEQQEAAYRMNEFFWDNTLVKAFKVKKTKANQRLLFNMWLNHLSENLSLKSKYRSNPNKINGIIVNSTHSQFEEYNELLDLAEMAETKELQYYLLALADIVQKPKIYSEYSRILEINGIGVDKNERKRGIGRFLLNESINLGERLGYDQIRCDCTNCIEGEALFRDDDWEEISQIPFKRYYNHIDEKLADSEIKIYKKFTPIPEI